MPDDVFRCTKCGHESDTWTVNCAACDKPNAYVSLSRSPSPGIDASPEHSAIAILSDVETQNESRIFSGFAALDDALGGGFVRGSVVLLAGAPGAGKSTLALAAAAHVSQEYRALYVSGEEPLNRLQTKARRLRVDVSALECCTYTEIGLLSRVLRQEHPAFVVVDSLHTIHNDWLRSRPGSPSQLIGAAHSFVRIAQALDICVFLIGHVTRINNLSGPRSVEHVVDVMLHFNAKGKKRRLFASKNRFGPANEDFALAMTGSGLVDA
jgi:DNA repair protein RadA/Sms